MLEHALELEKVSWKKLIAIDPTKAPYAPRVPKELIGTAVEMRMLLRICVAASGIVRSVDVKGSNAPEANVYATDAVRRWRYYPYRIDDVRVAFCYRQPSVLQAGCVRE